MEYKPLKLKVNHPSLPDEVLLFRDFDMLHDFSERYPGVDVKRLGKLAISLFRGDADHPNVSDMDYLGVGRENEDGGETWHLFFEHPEEMAYASNMAFDPERKQILHSMLRSNMFQSFQEKFGWFPEVVVDDIPTDFERECYIEWILSKEPDLHADLDKALREEFEE